MVIKLSSHVRCEVCGHVVDFRLIRNWNDRQVCTHCIASILKVSDEGELLHDQNK
jgi:formylmethanofuran dehydrogenase subunit E